MFGLSNRKNTRNNAIYAVTPVGKKKYEDALISGPTYEVLDYLVENGPSSVGEVAQNKGLSARMLENHMRLMARRGYINEVSGKDEL